MAKRGYQSENDSDYFDDSLIIDYESDCDNNYVPSARTTPSPSASNFTPSPGHPMVDERALSRVSPNAFESVSPPWKKRRIENNSESPILIAHSDKVVNLLNKFGVRWAVRFEIARLVSRGELKLSDITEDKIARLHSKNEIAGPQVRKVFFNSEVVDLAAAREIAASSPWAELDMEEAVLATCDDGGLGNNEKHPGWYGGKVEFSASVQCKDGQLKVELDTPTLGSSCRFTRKFGSWSFMRVRVPSTIFYDQAAALIPLFLRPIVIWGRVFRLCDSKTGSVFLYWTNERFERGRLAESGFGRKSLEEFIDWENPMKSNAQQSMNKWAARTTLGFSTSIPGPLLLPRNISSEKDIVNNGSDMTDGCGLSSQAIHMAVAKMLSLTIIPTAIQFRLGGRKGMLLMHTEGAYSGNVERVGCRPSQTKIKYPFRDPVEPALLTIDILRTSHMRSPGQLSNEVVINLADNGVPSTAFKKLLVDNIRELVKTLMTWDGPDAMFNLWIAVERCGGVVAARRARECIGEARARGYTNKTPDEIEAERDEDEDDAEDDDAAQATGHRSTAWWPDYTSGCPSSIEETILVMLDAGFKPQNSPMLRDKIHRLVKSKIAWRLKKLRMDIPQSCVAFAVPDPYGVLKSDEVHIRSSTRNLRTNDEGVMTDIITGDVLITRNPCKLATDVRKVKAVAHPKLHDLVDVIVFPTTGSRRLIDFLAGGDYDGDKVWTTWASNLVDSFVNADESFATEPPQLKNSFDVASETVKAFIRRVEDLSGVERRKAMQRYLIGALSNPKQIGKYSAMHDASTYVNGFKHPETVMLAYKFCKVLDSRKSGWKLKQDAYSTDLLNYDSRKPAELDVLQARKKGKKTEPSKSGAYAPTDNIVPLQRKLNPPFVTGNFILESLAREADEEEERLKVSTVKQFDSFGTTLDPDLVKPWLDLQQWAKKGHNLVILAAKEADLVKIQEHVRAVYNEYSTRVDDTFTPKPIEKRQDILRGLSKFFVSGPKLEDLVFIVDEAQLTRVRASYAYQYDCEVSNRGWSRFPFNVAMRELCAIKASAAGPHKVVQNDFYERFKLKERR